MLKYQEFHLFPVTLKKKLQLIYLGYRHTMTPLLQLGIIVVIGGLNEQSQDVHLNDLFIL